MENTQPRGGAAARPRPDKSPTNKTTAEKKRKVSYPKADFVKPTDIVRVKGGVDIPMLAIILLMLCFGSIMVFSASNAFSLQKYGDSYYYIRRQVVFAAVGLIAMVLAAIILDYRFLRRITIPIFLFAIALMCVVPIAGVGKGLARRWFRIGSITVQPSEIMKLALVLMLAWYMAKYQYKITDYSNMVRSSKYGILYPIFIMIPVMLLIIVENHFSCLIITFLIGMTVVFAGGGRKIWFGLAGALAFVVIFIAIKFSDYASLRLDCWLHPENYSADKEIYQTLQGLNAIGSGGIFGKGLGNSTQKHLYISEPMNDFIFSIICEELGLIGGCFVILLFAMFILRGIHIALRAPDTYSSLAALGITAKVAIQAILNMMVVTNMIPNTGISLPFFSYGGTALCMQLGEMGILLGISRYSYEQKPDREKKTTGAIY